MTIRTQTYVSMPEACLVYLLQSYTAKPCMVQSVQYHTYSRKDMLSLRGTISHNAYMYMYMYVHILHTVHWCVHLPSTSIDMCMHAHGTGTPMYTVDTYVPTLYIHCAVCVLTVPVIACSFSALAGLSYSASCDPQCRKCVISPQREQKGQNEQECKTSTPHKPTLHVPRRCIENTFLHKGVANGMHHLVD